MTSTLSARRIPTVKEARTALLKLAFRRGRIKTAELGGGSDSQFEQAFANLAHAFIKDKAPRMLDFELGFQLLEKDQDQTRAIGVFGFKIGNQLVYAPVFFLNGDLKGHELLYLKSQDLFVPMKESWIDYLLGRKPSVLGSGVTRNLSQLGVMPPNLYQLSRTPHKFASAGQAYRAPKLASWTYDVLPDLAYFATKPIGPDEKYKDMVDLPAFLRKEGKEVVVRLLKMAKQCPQLLIDIEKLYGPDMLKDVVAETKLAADQAAARPTSLLTGLVSVQKSAGLTIIAAEDVKGPAGLDLLHSLSQADRERLVKDRIVIKGQLTGGNGIVYNVQTPLKLQNPDRTGVYRVLVRPDRFEKCLVIMAPYSAQGRHEFCTVVTLEGDERRYINTHPSRIWHRGELDRDAWYAWFNKLSDADADLGGKKGLHIVLTPNGQGSVPFRLRESYRDDVPEAGLHCVSFRDYAEKDTPFFGGSYRSHNYISNTGYDSSDCCHPERIRVTGMVGAKLRTSGGELLVPAGCKVLKLSIEKKRKKQRDDEPDCLYESDPPLLQPGSMSDIQMFLLHHTHPLEIYSGSENVKVNDRSFGKRGALVHLVKDYRLTEDTARELLKRADGKLLKVRVKYADQYTDMIRNAPNAPPFPEPYVGYDPMTGGNVPTMQMSEFNVPVPDMSASRTDRSIYHPMGPEPDYQSMRSMSDAAQTGQKEVFDTAALGSLLKSVRDDSMIDRNIGDLMKGMDRCGRILFSFYWHGQEFENRYGKEDAPVLEDALRNTFESLGDLIIELKKKGVDTLDNNETQQTDLEASANM